MTVSTTHERATFGSRTRAGLWRLAGPWWMFLVTGIAWLIIAWVTLRFAPASLTTVGVLMGVLFLFALFNEILIAMVRSSWRWLHIVMAVIFAFGAGWAFARPLDAFWTLASILGLLLILRGTLDIITSAETREVNSLRWLGMVAGILEILIGFWAVQQYLRVQGALLLLWVGLFALFRGISEIVIAFELRRAQPPKRRWARLPIRDNLSTATGTGAAAVAGSWLARARAGRKASAAIVATAVTPAATSEPWCIPVMNACRTASAAAGCRAAGKCAAVMTPATTDCPASRARAGGAPSPVSAATTWLP